MFKNKMINFSLVNLLLLMHNMAAMETAYQYNYDDYVYPVISYTHKINQCFLNAYLLTKDSTDSSEVLATAKQEISKCYNYIGSLEKTIKDFIDLKERRLINIFETLAQHSPKKTRDLITNKILPQLSWKNNWANDVNFIAHSIISSLSNTRDRLILLNKTKNTSQEFRTDLDSIMKQYELIFSNFKNNTKRTQSNHRRQGIISTISNTFFSDILSTPHQKIELLLGEKDNLAEEIDDAEPLLSKSSKKTLVTISHGAKIISYMPFLETFCDWIVKNDNALIKKILGPQRYDTIKENSIFWIIKNYHVFLLIKKLHEQKLIRPIATNVHGFLDKHMDSYIINLMCNHRDEQPFVNYSNNLQKYFFIELLECLGRSHHRSIEMLERKNQRFSFAYEQEIVPCPNTNETTSQQRTKEKQESLWTLNNIKRSFDRAKLSDNIKSLGNHAFDVTKLFIHSLSPWYTSPTNNIRIGNTVNQEPKTLPTRPTVGNIEDFLLAITCDNKEKEPMNLTDAQQKINIQKQLFRKMIDAHKMLAKGYGDEYKKHKASTAASLPNEWTAVSVKINALYQSLTKLNEEKKDLWFFNAWGKIINLKERKSTAESLLRHVKAYNMTKINLYTKDTSYIARYNKSSEIVQESPYTQVRKEFLTEFPLSPQDKNDILKLSQKNNGLADCQYIFNPLEQAELKKLPKYENQLYIE